MKTPPKSHKTREGSSLRRMVGRALRDLGKARMGLGEAHGEAHATRSPMLDRIRTLRALVESVDDLAYQLARDLERTPNEPSSATAGQQKGQPNAD